MTVPHHNERTYRGMVRAKGLVSFHVEVRETDLWVSADSILAEETRALVIECRHQIERYIEACPSFRTRLTPVDEDPFAPPTVREMIEVTGPLGVGPMAAVAGAIAQYVGQGLLRMSDQVIVENGGDIFLHADRSLTVSILAGESPFSGRVGLRIPPDQMPTGVCASSGSVGHSLSLGGTDAACVLSPSAARADGAATALGNRVTCAEDLEGAVEWASRVEGLVGGVVIVGDRMATWGDVELVEI